MSTTIITPPAAPVVSGPAPVIAHSGKRYEFFNRNGFRGYVEMAEPAIPALEPFMSWTGPKISWSVWEQVCAFFEWSQKEFKSEVQVRLYVNHTTSRWAAWAYPQEPNGMTTKELDDHPDYAGQRAQFGRGWELMGTIHHHCTSGAFQSSTDTANERNQDGVHITVGKIGSSEYDLHGRVILRSNQFAINWSQWFNVPDSAVSYPPKLQIDIMNFFLKNPPSAAVSFPEAWKTNCIKPVATRTVYQGHHLGPSHSTSVGSGVSGVSGVAGGGSDPTSVDTDLESQFKPNEVVFMRQVITICDRNSKMTHTRLDYIFNEMKPETKEDITAVEDVRACGLRLGLDDERMCDLIDKWSFTHVCDELDRLARSKAAAPALPLLLQPSALVSTK